jgi:hypothetical protein
VQLHERHEDILYMSEGIGSTSPKMPREQCTVGHPDHFKSISHQGRRYSHGRRS